MEETLTIQLQNAEYIKAHTENPSDNRHRELALVKKIESKLLEKPLSILVKEYMLDSEGDNLNEAYSLEHQKEAELLRVGVERAEDPVTHTKVICNAVAQNEKLIPISLETKLQDHLEDILLTKEIEDSDGIKEYQEIDIVYRITGRSGF